MSECFDGLIKDKLNERLFDEVSKLFSAKSDMDITFIFVNRRGISIFASIRQIIYKVVLV